MDVRVITLRYQDALQGFSEEALRKAISGREVLEAREHFFLHGNVPHLLLTLLLGDVPVGGEAFRRSKAPDPEEGLEEERRPLYRELKRWRNERARADGKPAYAIARNIQLAEIARRVPRSLAELKEIEGIAGLVAEHHDGFSMWKSEITPWNAKDMGPKRDILQQF